LARAKENHPLRNPQHSRSGVSLGPRDRDVSPTGPVSGADLDSITAAENNGDDEHNAIW
jgi:hypothetical protein